MRNDAFQTHRGAGAIPQVNQNIFQPPAIGFAIGQRYSSQLSWGVGYLLFFTIFNITSFWVHDIYTTGFLAAIFIGFVGFFGFPSGDIKLRTTLWRWFPLYVTGFSVLLGFWLGETNYAAHIRWYHTLANGHAYTNVLPLNPAKNYRDASVIRFTNDAFVDQSKTVGFLDYENDPTQLYCAAPVITSGPISSETAITFWAVGLNCCNPSKSEFLCGSATATADSTTGGTNEYALQHRYYYKSSNYFHNAEIFEKTKTATAVTYQKGYWGFGEGFTSGREERMKRNYLKAVKMSNDRFALPEFKATDQILLLSWTEKPWEEANGLKSGGVIFFWVFSLIIGFLYLIGGLYVCPGAHSPANPEWTPGGNLA